MATTSELVGVYAGTGAVAVDSSGPFGCLMRRIVGLPLRGDVHRAELDVAPTIGGGEAWTRRFGDRRRHRRSVCSQLRVVDTDTVTECFGAVRLTFAVERGTGVTGPRMKLTSTTVWPIRFGRRWLSVDVFVGPHAGAAEQTSHVQARVFGGRLGTLDYSVVMPIRGGVR